MNDPQAGETRESKGLWHRVWPWLVVVAVVLFVGVIRIRVLDAPLERDEGEYAYAGQLLLQGIPPYELAYNMKLPGTYAAYMLGMAVFGQTTSGIHLTLLVVSSLNIIFVFLLAREIGGNLGGVIAGTSYGIMAGSPSVVGLAAHATHFVVLFAVPGIWLLYRAVSRDRNILIFPSALLLGVAFLMKQQGLCFGLFGFTFLAWMAWQKKDMFSKNFMLRMLVFGAGLALPFLLTCLVLAFAGVFGRFWFWTVDYARSYESILTLQQGIQEHLLYHLNQTRDLSMGLWALALVGLPVAWCIRRLRPAVIFSVLLWAFSFLGTSAGLYFRGHYFILLLPAFALLLGLAVVALREVCPAAVLPNVFKSLPLIFFGLILGWMLYYQAGFFFQWPAQRVSLQTYGEIVFSEVAVAADQIRSHSDRNARVAVMGSEPEIYFYAQRHSATGYIYVYALMEPQPFALDMQHEMAREIESAEPEFLVDVISRASWMPSPDSNPYLRNWFKQYSTNYYQKVGAVGCSPSGALVSFWGSATNITATGEERLDIYQRLPAITGR